MTLTKTVSKSILTPRERDVLNCLVNPKLEKQNNMAYLLGLTPATFKMYVHNLSIKLTGSGQSQRMLMLFAIAHRKQLELTLPTEDQFLGYKGVL